MSDSAAPPLTSGGASAADVVGWRRRLRSMSGADAISWPGWWVTTVLAVLLQLLGIRVLLQGNHQVVARIAIILVAQLAMWAVLIVVARPVLRRPSMRGRWGLTFVIFAAAGAGRAALAGWVGAQLGTPTLQPLPGRMLTSAATVAIALTFTAVVVGLVRRDSEQRAALAVDQRRLEHLRVDAIRNIELANRETVQEIRASLTRTFRDLEVGPDARAGDALRAAVEGVVRPISHELATRVPIRQPTPSEIAVPTVDWRATMRRATARFALFPVATGLGAAYLGIASTAPLYGSGPGLVLALLNGLAVWFALWLANSAQARWCVGMSPAARARSNVGLLLIAVVAAEVMLLPLTFRTDLPWAMMLGSVVMVPCIAWAANLAAALLRRQEQVQRELAATGDAVRADMARVREVQWARRRALAKAVHGPLQSTITAAAIRLDLAAAAGDPEDLDFPQLQAQILQSIDGLGAPAASDEQIHDAVLRLQRTWRGICRIDFTAGTRATEELRRRPETAQAVKEIIHEACANAVRHGGADVVAVSVAMAAVADPTLEVIVRDNGRGTLGEPGRTPGAVGLGTEILDELTSHWSRVATDQGCMLTAAVPIVVTPPIPPAPTRIEVGPRWDTLGPAQFRT